MASINSYYSLICAKSGSNATFFHRYLDGIVEKQVDATYLENILGE